MAYRSHPLTIDEAVQLALKQNPSILQQIQQLKVEKGLVYQAQARLLPQLTAEFQLFAERQRLEPTSSVLPANLRSIFLAVPSERWLARPEAR